MHDNVIRLYTDGQLTQSGLARAVGYGWITSDEYEDLTGEAYTPPEDETADMQSALELLGVEPEEAV